MTRFSKKTSTVHGINLEDSGQRCVCVQEVHNLFHLVSLSSHVMRHFVRVLQKASK